MAVYNLVITTTQDQETALTDLAALTKSNNQAVLLDQISRLLFNLVNNQIQVDLTKLQQDSLTTLETLATESPQSLPVNQLT